MVKKSAIILGILAMLTVGAGMSWSYTVTQWPVPGIPNQFFPGGASPCLVTPEMTTLRGPVAPACDPPLIPGVIHAGLSIPFRALGLVFSPLFTGGCPGDPCCKVDLGDPAYVLAAVPCTPVNTYSPPKGW